MEVEAIEPVGERHVDRRGSAAAASAARQRHRGREHRSAWVVSVDQRGRLDYLSLQPDLESARRLAREREAQAALEAARARSGSVEPLAGLAQRVRVAPARPARSPRRPGRRAARPRAPGPGSRVADAEPLTGSPAATSAPAAWARRRSASASRRRRSAESQRSMPATCERAPAGARRRRLRPARRPASAACGRGLGGRDDEHPAAGVAVRGDLQPARAAERARRARSGSRPRSRRRPRRARSPRR